jgi:hypothetical protein
MHKPNIIFLPRPIALSPTLVSCGALCCRCSCALVPASIMNPTHTKRTLGSGTQRLPRPSSFGVENATYPNPNIHRHLANHGASSDTDDDAGSTKKRRRIVIDDFEYDSDDPIWETDDTTPASTAVAACVSSQEEDCLLDNGSGKTETQDTPVGEMARRARAAAAQKAADEKDIIFIDSDSDDDGQDDEDASNKSKGLDALFFQKLRTVINSTTDEAELAQRVVKAMRDGKTTTNTCYLWISLFKKHVVPGSRLAAILLAAKKSDANNAGNTTKGPGKAKAKQELTVMQGSLEELKKTHLPPKDSEYGPWFWIKEKGNSTVPPEGTVTDCGTDVFPGVDENGKKRVIFTAYAHEGLRNRFDKIADRHLTLLPKLNPKRAASNDGTAFVLVRIAKRRPTTKKSGSK